MSIVVSDTSPIRAFHFLKQTDILRVLFATVIIPPVVANELAHPHGTFDPLDLSGIQFIEVRAPRDQQRVAQYAAALDLGEAEAIVLAIELGTMLLIDEIDGRTAAAAAGVPFVGVLGVLARAKREGLIGEVRPLVDALRSGLRFRIGQRLYEEFLQTIGERC
jgi:predicted nucleic acid-binding protein